MHSLLLIGTCLADVPRVETPGFGTLSYLDNFDVLDVRSSDRVGMCASSARCSPHHPLLDASS